MPQHDISLTTYTGKLKLVPPTAIDDEVVAALRTHPGTVRFLSFMPTSMTAEDVRKRRETRADDDTILDFNVHDNTDTVLGMAGLFNIDTGDAANSCELGVLVAPGHHGGGLATDIVHTLLGYAFEERGIHRVVFQTGVDNAPMRGWLEKVAGARLEARYRGVWRDGGEGYVDAVGYSVLRTEWDGVRGRLRGRMDGVVLSSKP